MHTYYINIAYILHIIYRRQLQRIKLHIEIVNLKPVTPTRILLPRSRALSPSNFHRAGWDLARSRVFSQLHTRIAHAHCTRALHTRFAHAHCTRAMHTSNAHAQCTLQYCTRALHTRIAHVHCTRTRIAHAHC